MVINLIRKLILPNVSKKLFVMSISRYSNSVYQSARCPIFMDLAYLFSIPFIGLYMLTKSVPVPVNASGSEILCEAISAEYKNSFMSNLVSALKYKNIRYAGKGLDCDGIADNQFLKIDAFRVIFTGWIVFPCVLIITLFGNISLSRALIKTLLIYYRSYRFFQYNPANIFLTVRDNTCSSALYSSFHNCGGVYLCAIQNGLRGVKSGVDYSYIDHFFALNNYTIHLFQSLGSVINNSDIVPTLPLDKYIKSIKSIKSIKESDIDILFIDQGFPVNGLEMWLPLKTGKDVLRFLDQVKEFSLSHKKIQTVYLMRKYDSEQSYISDAIENWAKDTNITLKYPCDSNESYHMVSKSKLVVTMDSTLGLEAISLGVDTLFFNLKNDQNLNTCGLPYQHKLRDYQYFKNVLNSALYSKMEANNEVIDLYAPPVINGSKLISDQIKKYEKLV